jgi:hypothetical protein
LKESKGRPTGTIQEKILQVLRDGTEENEEGEQTCEISYRELGIATGVNTPRAATCMKSLVGRGVVKKIKPGTGGKNHYQVVEK